MSVLCLVPSALQASRAARRLCDAEGGLLFGPRVATPEALSAALLASAGDARPLLTPLAERLLALEAGDAAGGALSGLAATSGLAAALAATLREFRAAEVPAAALRAAAASLRGRAAERLELAAAALAAYEERLEALGALDAAAAVRAAVEALHRADPELRAPDVLVVQGFHALAPAAFDLVAALAARARRTVAHVPFFPERADVCAPAEALVRRLEALHELSARRDVSVALESLAAEGRAPRLSGLLRAVAGGATPPGAPGEGLVFAAVGAGAAGEAQAAADAALRLVDVGFSPEDVAFVAAAPARLAPRLAAACAARGIPFSAGSPGPLAALPVVTAVRAALVAAERPDRSALEAVASSPWLRLARVPDRLGFWLDRAGVIDGRRPPEEALRARAERLSGRAAAAERAALLRSAAAVSELRAALRPLATPGTAREHAARLRGFLVAAGARRRAARGEPTAARRDVAALSRVEDAADALVTALALLGRAGERLASTWWRDRLELALESSAAPAASEPAAGAAELWALSEARGLSARAAVLVGCTRGAFPAAARPDPLLRDPERVTVNRVLRQSALATSASRRAESLHAAYCAVAAGREAVAFTWAGAGPEGAGAGPAPLAVEALEAAGAEIPVSPSPPASLGATRTAADALSACARAHRDGRGVEAVAALAAADPGLASRAASALARGALEAERGAAVAARRASPAAGGVPPALLPELWAALPEEWSPSELETHARCPYRLFAARVLSLAEPEAVDLDIDRRDEGSLAHAILEAFLRERMAAGAVPLRGGRDDLDALRRAADATFARFERDGRVGDPAPWAARRRTILARLERVVAAEARGSGGPGDAVAPALIEYRFGGDSGVPPLAFRDGDVEVRLRGRLDRVDAGAERLVLLDYKDARNGAAYAEKLERESLGEANFQVPAYLMAAARALPGRGTLEASYVLLRSAERVGPFRAEAGDPLLAVEPEPRARARALGVRPFADAVLDAVGRIRGGALPIASRDCAGCAFGAVCRFETLAEADS